ncbi:MAG: hypothetical protein Q7K45_05850 [Nanoarchaeota archaeon]|nr:hypothetical protein [Nanoarchaeota archaeon]
MAYTKIKSAFIRAEMKKTKWKDKDYIDDLIDIEGFALGRTFGMVTPHLRNRVVKKYPRQWKIIYLELNPQGYNENVEYEKKERERERKENVKFRREEALELKQERIAWMKSGGKI